MGFYVLVTQFMSSPVLGAGKNLVEQKSVRQLRGLSPPEMSRTLAHPGYSHACTRFPFLALVTRFLVPAVDEGDDRAVGPFILSGSEFWKPSIDVLEVKVCEMLRVCGDGESRYDDIGAMKWHGSWGRLQLMDIFS